MSTEQKIEQEIQDKELTAPRIKPQMLDDAIKSEEYHVLNNTLTVCILTLQNGFTVTGESACASPENFDEEIGQSIAKGNARDKLWPLLGFLLCELIGPSKDNIMDSIMDGNGLNY